MQNPEILQTTKARRRRKQLIRELATWGVLAFILVSLAFQNVMVWNTYNVVKEPKQEVVEHYVTVPVVVETSIEPEPVMVVSRGTISRELPQGADGSFKTYMDYRTITDKTSKQYALQEGAVTDDFGFRLLDNKYMVAVGTYYAEQVGKELLVTLSTGKQIEVVVGDIKDDRHTDENNQYIPVNGNIVEFIVDTDVLNKTALKLGDVSIIDLEGAIIAIEEVLE